jgi:hypothetical protein
MTRKTDTRDKFAATIGALLEVTNDGWLLATACSRCGAAVGEPCVLPKRLDTTNIQGHADRLDRANRGLNSRGHFAACLAELDTGLVSLPTAFRLLRANKVYKTAIKAGYLGI